VVFSFLRRAAVSFSLCGYGWWKEEGRGSGRRGFIPSFWKGEVGGGRRRGNNNNNSNFILL
jgi:hypothetical protein